MQTVCLFSFSSALCTTNLCLSVLRRQVPTPARSQSLHLNHKRRRITPRPRKWLLSKSNWEASTASGNAHRYDRSLPSLLSHRHTVKTYNKVFTQEVCLPLHRARRTSPTWTATSRTAARTASPSPRDPTAAAAAAKRSRPRANPRKRKVRLHTPAALCFLFLS